jgi:signal transduction histidine kinase
VLLDERGLEVAVRSAALLSPVPTKVEVIDLGEYPGEIVTAVYFCCVEALQNIAKHARGARSARIVLREAGSVLSFSVSDDGPGLIDHDARIGSGMLNMRDRMTTVGGKLTVQSRPGQGTRVSGRVPLTAVAHPGAPHGARHASRRTATARRRDHTEP